jgi:non-specific serine/threonine protein kinase/serine/threonine-protein kinase
LHTTRTEAQDGECGGSVGPYHLLQRVGEGGMGEVWLAEQGKPVRRQVALKLIKAGMDTKQVVARFESERQALALMNHPNIARVFDAGETEQGRPYFAMEYVKGVSIIEYCDTHRLRTRDRLELFVQVCEGVQHAHQKGVIHRDIKPSNVLVAIQDDRPVPKIIDFGVAKATEQRLTEKTMFTQLGALIGTPEYMSPEQADLTGLDVDTRTDVYSLGVLLYEMLVGVLPFDSKELRKAGFDEIRRRIREDEPSRPSTRVSTLGESAADSARNRKTDPGTLSRRLRGDLDWITMKALEKDRTRRYGSPSEMAADIGRHLEDQPVHASPPSTAYRVGKFVRRHKLSVAAAGVVLLALVVGLSGATYGLIRATRAEAQARQEAATAGQVSDFLVGLFEVSDPSEARGNSITAREILDQGAAKVDEELSGQPLVQARLLTTIGSVYRNLGLYSDARPLLEQALVQRRRLLGDEHLETLNTIGEVAQVDTLEGQYEEAARKLESALETLRNEYGEEAQDTIWVMGGLGEIYRNLGRKHEAESFLVRALESGSRILGEDHPDMLVVRSNLALVYQQLGRLEDGANLEREILQIRRRALGNDHPNTLASMQNLATAYQNLDRYDEAEPLLMEAMATSQRVNGEEHMLTFTIKNNLAFQYKQLEKYDEAEPLYVELLESMRRALGEDHPMRWVTMGNLGDVYIGQDRYEDAERLLRPAVDGVKKTLPRIHIMTGFTIRKYGACLTGLRRFPEAEALLLEAREILVEAAGPEHFQTARAVSDLVALHDAWGKPAKATEWRAKLPSESEDP